MIKPTWDRGHYRLGLALEAKGEMADAQVSITVVCVNIMYTSQSICGSMCFKRYIVDLLR